MPSVAVLASGRGTNLEALLEAQREGRLGSASIELVVSDNEDADALGRAERYGVETRFLDPSGKERKGYDEELVELLADAGIDLVVLAGFMRILSPVFLSAFTDRVINVHPAILPAFPGMHAQQQALDGGVRIAGATTHFVTTEVDDGPIILQSAVPVHPDDTEETLSDRILETEHEILPASVRLFAEGRLAVSDGRVEIKGDVDVPKRALIVPEVTA